MVKKKSIAIRIQKDGSIDMDVLNAEGAECLSWTQPIEEAFAGMTSEKQLKLQFYEESKQSVDLNDEES